MILDQNNHSMQKNNKHDRHVFVAQWKMYRFRDSILLAVSINKPFGVSRLNWLNRRFINLNWFWLINHWVETKNTDRKQLLFSSFFLKKEIQRRNLLLFFLLNSSTWKYILMNGYRKFLWKKRIKTKTRKREKKTKGNKYLQFRGKHYLSSKSRRFNWFLRIRYNSTFSLHLLKINNISIIFCCIFLNVGMLNDVVDIHMI